MNASQQQPGGAASPATTFVAKSVSGYFIDSNGVKGLPSANRCLTIKLTPGELSIKGPFVLRLSGLPAFTRTIPMDLIEKVEEAKLYDKFETARVTFIAEKGERLCMEFVFTKWLSLYGAVHLENRNKFIETLRSAMKK